MKQTFIAAVMAACIGGGDIAAQNIDRNVYADENKALFSSPKSDAMANSDGGVSGGAALLSNPAALLNGPMKELSLFYAGYYRNTFSTSGISYSGPIDSMSSLGASVSYLLMPDIELHPEEPGEPVYNPTHVQTRTGSDCYVRIAYARELYRFGKTIELSAGAAINGNRQNLVGLTGYGIGADAGVNLFFRDIGLTTGIVADNLTTSYTRWHDYKAYAPPHVRAGFGWQREFPYIYGKLSAAYLSPDIMSNEGINSIGSDTLNANTDVELPEFKRVSQNPGMMITGARYGVQYTIMNKVSFRAGLRMGTISFGGGLRLLHDRAGIDFAYLIHSLAPTYKLSMDFRWL